MTSRPSITALPPPLVMRPGMGRLRSDPAHQRRYADAESQIDELPAASASMAIAV